MDWNKGNPKIKRKSNLTETSQKLRKEMTIPEKILWYRFLRRLPIHFYRQKVFGKYIVDFYCHEAKIIIELDGNQHLLPEAKAYDELRDREFLNEGILVLRYKNREIIENFDEVCEDIRNHLYEAVSGVVIEE